MNIFAEQQWRQRHREQIYGHGGGWKKERVEEMERDGSKDANFHL